MTRYRNTLHGPSEMSEPGRGPPGSMMRWCSRSMTGSLLSMEVLGVSVMKGCSTLPLGTAGSIVSLTAKLRHHRTRDAVYGRQRAESTPLPSTATTSAPVFVVGVCSSSNSMATDSRRE